MIPEQSLITALYWYMYLHKESTTWDVAGAKIRGQ